MEGLTSEMLPPILPDIEQQLKEYIICPERLPIHSIENNQKFWEPDNNILDLLSTERAPVGTTLMVKRDYNTGKIIEFCEVPLPGAGSTPKNSLSLNREPAPLTDSVRGSPSNFPFWPGGIPFPEVNIQDEDASNDFNELLTVPPGFSRGLSFADDGCTVISEDTKERKDTQIYQDDLEEKKVNLMELVQQEQHILGLWNDNKNIKTDDVSKAPKESTLNEEELEVLPKEQDIPILKISEYKKVEDTKWSVLIDIQKPVDDFHEKIPELAHKYPFELDTFQKQAILKLEENCDVFVAAHTSAGKTVVAEYAIALSQKHNTRTIYTSPIKALSNQKYRDFKHTFQDVGLITGDFQINQTGVCLIMTTEILRSMLYCGSEVTRDLEYVIFDEVHYINDAERGHVWEEVLILLPSHVRIVLLSATVPNALEFANWLGQTKQRKVYVISTLYRPVPLQHYLYTGCEGKSKDEPFLIIDDKGTFLLDQHREATAAVEKKRKDAKPKYVSRDRTKQEEIGWGGLINYLRRNDLLPVVVFTFSRGLCDRSAQMLCLPDLTTAKEKSKIHSFYQQCIKRLKEPDQKLPQIIRMQNILKKGIGVHHSGVLPIVKEIVEMLFQNSLVKIISLPLRMSHQGRTMKRNLYNYFVEEAENGWPLISVKQCQKILFATETFAMGVNMPARTVIFNGIEKFDGIDVRFLKPAEYIQMAGRAGRRGLDSSGTVIIKCKDKVPDVVKLRTMMQGKPQKLESQFRLTSGMLLSILRVESLTIESVMTHSFHEVGHISKADRLKTELKLTEKELSEECTKEIGDHLKNLVKFYDAASDYIKEWNELQPKILQQQRVVKEMVPGRVLLISYKSHVNKLAILLNVTTKKGTIYKVLVLDNARNQSENIELKLANVNNEKNRKKEKEDDHWYKMLSFSQDGVYQPEGVGGHAVLEISAVDILKITSKIIKLDTNLIIQDWEKRQIPRFRDDPPGQTCYQAIQALTKLTETVASDPTNIYFTESDYHIRDVDLTLQMNYLKHKKSNLDLFKNYTKIANFEEQFSTVYKRKHLEEKVDYLRFMISHRSLTLYPEYLSRIEVLKQLRYINDQNRVDLKGRVACTMGMNELLITELVFRGTLANLDACEVAALLSALVFQAKSDMEPELTDSLKQGMESIMAINLEIENLEHKHHIRATDGKESNLNFKLVQVVYEWARDKPFAEIMTLTDVQEGIIVRCIQQLNEILKDVKEAAMIIGDPVLQQKMEDASNAIKRDIVFAASLYTQKEAAMISV